MVQWRPRAYPTTRFQQRRYKSNVRYRARGGRRSTVSRRFVSNGGAKPESKFLFTHATGDAVLNIPFIIHVSHIVPGVGINARVANFVQPTNLYGHINVTGDGAASAVTSQVRLCFVQWHEDDSKSSFDGQRLLQDQQAPGGPWNVSEKGVFTILWSHYCTVTNNLENAKLSKTLRFDIKMHRRQRVLYDASASKKHQIFFCAMSDIVGFGPFPHVDAQIQLRFTDS